MARFGHEQVDVFRHQHIPEDHKAMASAKRFEREKEVCPQRIIQKQGFAAVATEGQEMVISVRVYLFRELGTVGV